MARCPGQDMRYWLPEDIFDVKCPYCGEEIEFWKDEPVRLCRGCGQEIRNPRINLGCAKWCKSAKECLGSIPEEHIAAAPIIETLRAKLMVALKDHPELMQRAETIHALADTLLSAEGGDPCIIKAGAMLCVLSDPAYKTLQRELIELIGIEPDRTVKLQAVLTALSSAKCLDDVEYAVLSDAIQITNFAELPEMGDTHELLDSLLSNGGRVLARRRFED